MPVIGRLDEQVGRLIIDPVSRRRRDAEDPTPDAPTPPAEPDAPAEESEERRERTELPVWLL